MREILPEIQKWCLEGKRVAVATIVKVYGSAPRPLGSKMAVSSSGEVVGSVSGGCIEGAVIEEAQKTIESGNSGLLAFGISNSQAWDVGLACGGDVEVFVEPYMGRSVPGDLYDALISTLEQRQLVALATIIKGSGVGSKMIIWPDGRTAGSLGNFDLDVFSIASAGDHLRTQSSGEINFEKDDRSYRIFLDVFPPPPRLFIIGAVHIAIPLVIFANPLGFHTIVIDARSFFATRERFPLAGQLEVGWPPDIIRQLDPDVSSDVVILTHDDKFDIPSLQAALESPARYIGILGSRSTHAKRIQALKELGFTDNDLSRVHAPVGLSIGSVGAEEIALSIISEIIAAKNGKL